MAADSEALLFKGKQIKLLLALNDEEQPKLYLSSLAKMAGVTYVHTTKFIKKCENIGLVGSEKHGKIKTIFLTEKGKAVVQNVISIMDSMKKEEKNEEEA